MKYNKDFGFGSYEYNNINKKCKLIDNLNYYIAIPYNYVNSPVNGSEFTDYELCLLLTIKSYKEIKENKEIFRDYDLLLLFYIFNDKYG
jgi:hypothetical protein